MYTGVQTWFHQVLLGKLYCHILLAVLSLIRVCFFTTLSRCWFVYPTTDSNSFHVPLLWFFQLVSRIFNTLFYSFWYILLFWQYFPTLCLLSTDSITIFHYLWKILIFFNKIGPESKLQWKSSSVLLVQPAIIFFYPTVDGLFGLHMTILLLLYVIQKG